MCTRKIQYIKKNIIFILLISVSIVITTFATVVYDSTIQNRAITLMNTIKTNAEKLSLSDSTSYYSLIRLNIKSLMQVLTLVDEGIALEQ